MGSMRDTERLGIIRSMASEFVQFGITANLSKPGRQCVTQKVCGRWKSDTTRDSTNSVDTWKQKQAISFCSLKPFIASEFNPYVFRHILQPFLNFVVNANKIVKVLSN